MIRMNGALILNNVINNLIFKQESKFTVEDIIKSAINIFPDILKEDIENAVFNKINILSTIELLLNTGSVYEMCRD